GPPMRTPAVTALLSTALLSVGGLSLAATLQDGQALFDKGDWQGAATLGLSLGGAGGEVLAAKATTLGASVSPEASRKAMYQKAQGYAREAIRLDQGSADAYFELARADGRLAQFSGILQSLGLAGEVKKSLDTALRLNPRMAGAYVALGLWNAELAAKGFLATASTGASARNVVPSFEKAVALEPTTIVHRLEYANALLKLSPQNRAAALEQLNRAATFTPLTFWDRQDLAAVRARLAELK
ncbi:MAG: hypothetical protein ACR2J4_03715, partial [Deinococcus sp.]